MPLQDKTVYFLGKLAASNRKKATQVVRGHGGTVVNNLGPSIQIVVVGEGDVLSRDWNLWNDQLDAATQEAFEAGTLEIMPESFFWESYGDASQNQGHESRTTGPLYTTTMLSELAGLSKTHVRRLILRRLITPVRQVHRLCYFGVEAILLLKIVRNMLAAGFSFTGTVNRLLQVRNHLAEEPFDVNVEGTEALFITKQGPMDQVGQRHFLFVLDTADTADLEQVANETCSLEILDSVLQPQVSPSPCDSSAIREAAMVLESEGNLREALDLYRIALSAGGPDPQVSFQIADLLYRFGDLTGARERYFMAVEQDEEFVEARANLGCILVELGENNLALAAFRGALKYHPEYAEVHFHLGMLLYQLKDDREAAKHFRLFLKWAPNSSWAERIPYMPEMDEVSD